MIRALGVALLGLGALVAPASTRSLDATTSAFAQPGPYGVGVRDLTLVDQTRPTPAHGSQPELPARTLATRRFYRRAGPPLLVMQGDQDAIVPLEANGGRAFTFARRSPRELVILLHGTHTAFAGPIVQGYDAVGCSLILRVFTPDLLAQFQMAKEFHDAGTGIDVNQCGLPCQGLLPDGPMPASRQHALAVATMSAFFESTLGHSSAARCFLRRGLARENRADVRVALRGGRR